MNYKEKVIALLKSQELSKEQKEKLEDIFPELKESEDEKIRKSIIELLNEVHFTFKYYDIKKMLAWLEKQQKPNPYSGTSFEYNGHTWGMCARDNGVEILIDGNLKGRVFRDNSNAKKMFIKALERVEEQNSKGYKLTDCDKNSWWEDFKTYTSCIVEQKPDDKKGMNLVEEEMTPFQKKVFCIIDTTIEKEQGLKQVCDELLALASNEIKQKPAAWSEEDESRMNNLCHFLEEYGNQYYGHLTLQGTISWLKSLRPQSQWKPTDEQIRELGIVATGKGWFSKKILSELMEQLNKLKG